MSDKIRIVSAATAQLYPLIKGGEGKKAYQLILKDAALFSGDKKKINAYRAVVTEIIGSAEFKNISGTYEELIREVLD